MILIYDGRNVGDLQTKFVSQSLKNFFMTSTVVLIKEFLGICRGSTTW